MLPQRQLKLREIPSATFREMFLFSGLNKTKHSFFFVLLCFLHFVTVWCIAIRRSFHGFVLILSLLVVIFPIAITRSYCGAFLSLKFQQRFQKVVHWSSLKIDLLTGQTVELRKTLSAIPIVWYILLPLYNRTYVF